MKMNIIKNYKRFISQKNIKSINKYKKKFAEKKKKISIIPKKIFKILFKILKLIFILFFFLTPRSLYFKKFLIILQKQKEEEINMEKSEEGFFNYFKSLKNISYENISLLTEYRNTLLNIFSRNSKKNVTSVDNIYINFQFNVGNQLVLMNKVIFYCEILKCKKVILGPNNNVYIKNTINDEKFNLTIEIAQPNITYDQDFVSILWLSRN